jgi:molybdenum cofactor guanylyltransferase
MFKGLILCGGRSTRMEEDKSLIAYHGMPQWEYTYNLLLQFLPEVYLSCRADQSEIINSGKPVIIDSVVGSDHKSGGPSVGLLSAYAAQPSTTWLVLACDLPLLSAQSLEFLIARRDPSKDATAFTNPVSLFPEPLVAIWEPSGLAKLKLSVDEGRNCPRKTLENGDIVNVSNRYWAEQFNANTQEDKAEAMNKIV